MELSPFVLLFIYPFTLDMMKKERERDRTLVVVVPTLWPG